MINAVFQRLVVIGAIYSVTAVAGAEDAVVSSRTHPSTGEVEMKIQDRRGVGPYQVIDPGAKVVDFSGDGGCHWEAVIPLWLFYDHDPTRFVDYSPCDGSAREYWSVHHYPVIEDGAPWLPAVSQTTTTSIQIDDVDNDGRRDVLVVNKSTGTLSVFRNSGDGILADPDVYSLNPGVIPVDTSETPVDINSGLAPGLVDEVGPIDDTPFFVNETVIGASAKNMGFECKFSCGSFTNYLYVCAANQTDASKACKQLLGKPSCTLIHTLTAPSYDVNC